VSSEAGTAAQSDYSDIRRKKLIGKPITILIPPGRPNEELEILERIKRGERVEHYENRAPTQVRRLD